MRELVTETATGDLDLQFDEQVTLGMLVLFLLIPLFTGPYLTALMTNMVLFIIVAIGLNLLSGVLEYISIGHAMFFGAGAYTTAYLTVETGLGFVSSFVVMLVFVVVMGFVVGKLSFVAQGIYFALLTFAFNFFFQTLVSVLDFLGGPVGITGLPLPAGFLSSTTNYYYFSFGFLVLGVLGWLVLSKTGFIETISLIGENEMLAENVGIDTGRYKMITFMISVVYAAVAGSLYAHNLRLTSPDLLGFLFSIEFLVIIILGGVGSLPGVFLGGIAYTGITEVSTQIGDVPLLIQGVLILAVMLLMPEGIAGFLLDSESDGGGGWPGELAKRLRGFFD